MRSTCCLCVCVSPPNVARQRLGKHIHTATNIHTTIELLDGMFSMRSVSYHILNICSERKVGY
jgi:hypothetical protein